MRSSFNQSLGVTEDWDALQQAPAVSQGHVHVEGVAGRELMRQPCWVMLGVTGCKGSSLEHQQPGLTARLSPPSSILHTATKIAMKSLRTLLCVLAALALLLGESWAAPVLLLPHCRACGCLRSVHEASPALRPCAGRPSLSEYVCGPSET